MSFSDSSFTPNVIPKSGVWFETHTAGDGSSVVYICAAGDYGKIVNKRKINDSHSISGSTLTVVSYADPAVAPYVGSDITSHTTEWGEYKTAQSLSQSGPV